MMVLMVQMLPTKNKEISFKTNAGALDGIPIGNAGEFLKVNSGATGYEFGDYLLIM